MPIATAPATFDVPAEELDAHGLTPAEEQTYRLVRDQPGATLSHLLTHLPLTATATRAALSALQVRGLIRCTSRRPHRYAAQGAPAKVPADRPVPRRTPALRTPTLTTPLPPEPAPRLCVVGEPALEILDRRDDILRAIGQVQRKALRECVCLDKPPYVLGPPDTVDRGELAVLARGVGYRTLIDVESFNFPGVAERVRISLDAGVQVRMGSRLPLKMLIADGSAGLIPLNLQDPGGPILRLGPSSLLDTLRISFELLWQAATPLTLSRSGRLKLAASPVKLPVDIDELVPRLAAGVNDKTIAHDLGVSPRTFDRRIDAFMKHLNARTRFQAGWLAAHRFHERTDP